MAVLTLFIDIDLNVTALNYYCFMFHLHDWPSALGCYRVAMIYFSLIIVDCALYVDNLIHVRSFNNLIISALRILIQHLVYQIWCYL